MEATTTDHGADVLSSRLVDAIAAYAEIDPLQMEPLYNVVDPDALEMLIARGTDVSVSFDYADHSVVVQGDGTVSVDGHAYDANAEGFES